MLLPKQVYFDADFITIVISYVSCDVGGPIASTIKASTIADPFFGYNPETGKAEEPFTSSKNNTVMQLIIYLENF